MDQSLLYWACLLTQGALVLNLASALTAKKPNLMWTRISGALMNGFAALGACLVPSFSGMAAGVATMSIPLLFVFWQQHAEA
ncbi:MAG TPA: hypothetical protein VN495_00905 [Candidatus Paceibacterota bacterium]|nr:hypothetical protein [Candidatus Paceibacterota bacterium]